VKGRVHSGHFGQKTLQNFRIRWTTRCRRRRVIILIHRSNTTITCICFVCLRQQLQYARGYLVWKEVSFLFGLGFHFQEAGFRFKEKNS